MFGRLRPVLDPIRMGAKAVLNEPPIKDERQSLGDTCAKVATIRMGASV